MKKLIFTLVLSFIAGFIFLSCSSSDDDLAETQSVAQGFKWKENSETAAENTAPSARFQVNSIFASDANNATIFEINLMQSSAVGTYTFDGDYINGTALAFVPDNFTASSGTITITDKTSSTISGKFEAIGSGNSLTKIYGTFTNIPIN